MFDDEDITLPVKPVYILNAGQENAKAVIMDYINDRLPGVDYITFQGYAGTGKTFTLNRIVEAIREQDHGRRAFGMTAPTHKAVRQLKKHSELREELDFGTIHSFLGLKEVLKPHPRHKNKMIVRYEPDFMAKEKRIDSISVLIVDESSMLGNALFEHIDTYRRSRPSLKVIFTGDPLQIPPVKDKDEDDPDDYGKDAIPFIQAQQQSRRIQVVTLDEIVRQGMDNPIIAYATAIREQYKNQAIKHTFTHSDTTGVEAVPRNLDQLNALFSKYFDCEEFRQDPDHMKVVAWRNDTVNYFNGLVRVLIHKQEKLPRIVDGEKLVLNKPIIKGDKVLIANNEELVVLNHVMVTLPVKYKLIDRNTNAFAQAASDGFEGEIGVKVCSQDFRAYACTVNTVDKKTYIINVMHEDDIAEFEQLKAKIESLAKRCSDMYDRKEMWKQFYGLDKQFANVNYNYCITAHKAQGSTYDYCMSMEWDIDQNRSIEERNRIRYVAATRARNKLFIVR